ncbi:threonine/serine exporter family protein [Vibrio parahaemolyticus]|nr:threonine/serine exporter family protein [Vibrio parahaemolyticus]
MTMNDDDFELACQFMIDLAILGHRSGLNAPYLESSLSDFAAHLGFSAHLLATPKWFNFIFWREGDLQQRRHFVPVPAVNYNLSRLAEIGHLIHQLRHGKFTVAQSREQLKQIEQSAPPYGDVIVGLGYLFAGIGFAVLLSASWLDVALSGLLSLVVYTLVILTNHSTWLAQRLEMTAAFVSAVCAYSLAMLVFPGSDAFTVTLCTVIVFIPGLALTLGIGEIFAKSILSGTSRLIDGIAITLKLYLGAALGGWLVNTIQPIPSAVVSSSMPVAIQWISVLALILGIALVFQVRYRDLVWAVLAGAIAYGGSKLGGQLGPWQGSFLGALFLGCYAHLFAWFRKEPTAVVWLPGVMILVPGAAAYLGVNIMETSGVVSSFTAFTNVMVQIGAIVSGIVIATSVMPRRSRERT